MSNQKLGYSNFVRWTLKSELAKTLEIPEPINWDANDALKMKRHDEYHGMIFTYTGSLVFTHEAMDYIEEAYVSGGINAKCRLTKYVLVEKDDDVKWVERYSFLADWETKIIENQQLSIKWNTFNLEELVRSHESDRFEAERVDSIDGVVLDELILDSTEIPGRLLNFGGQSRKLTGEEGGFGSIEAPGGQIERTFKSKLIGLGDDRHASIDVNEASVATLTSSSMFFVKVQSPVNDVIVDVEYDLAYNGGDGVFHDTAGDIISKLRLVEWDGNDWFLVEDRILDTIYTDIGVKKYITIKGKERFENVAYNQGLLIVYEAPSRIGCTIQDLKVNVISHEDASPNLSCIFIHDLMERLMYILTGEKDKFYSKYFGRTEVLNKNGNQKYLQDGDAGLMAYITGFWLRAFDPESDKYKSITTSIKQELKNLKAVYNIGATIESNGLEERLRFEDLRFFYRQELVVKFPNQLNNEVRKIDSDLFFSAIEFGYDKADDYEDENGLDEPNQSSSFVTPIRRSQGKYSMLSKTRADDTAMELTRRKPAIEFPNEDTKRDDDIFFLDLKRTTGLGYTQKIWSDRLKELPFGIFSPETWKGMFFTPMRMMLRHSWIFRAGIEPYLNKFVKHMNSTGNKNIETHAGDDWRIGEDVPISENSDIQVSTLERSRFLPTIVTAEHVISEELWEWINGTTEVVIHGEVENVPNYFFKMQFINENGITERGYLMELEPKGKGKIVYQLANENLI